LDSSQVFRRAVEEKVAFVPGPAFYPGGDEQVGPVRRGDEFARLAFTFADDAQIDEGCRRLGRVLAH
jgi:DNA-binding transcriptional MocR family regulator